MDRDELKKKLLEVGSAEDVIKIFKDAGEEIPAEDAAQILEEAKKLKNDSELSIEELEAVSGGRSDRDYATMGCAATVEYKSWCGTNDACYAIDVTYDHFPCNLKCFSCGTFMYEESWEFKSDNYTKHIKCRCPKCGAYDWMYSYR